MTRFYPRSPRGRGRPPRVRRPHQWPRLMDFMFFVVEVLANPDFIRLLEAVWMIGYQPCKCQNVRPQQPDQWEVHY